jgi:hypothetical protein
VEQQVKRDGQTVMEMVEQVPDWVVPTPFRVALRNGSHGCFDEAIRRMGLNYSLWTPARAPAPWRVESGEGSNYTAEMTAWTELMQQCYVASMPEVLTSFTHDIIGGMKAAEHALDVGDGQVRVVVMGCAPFNGPHTDVTTSFLDRKLQAVRQQVGGLLEGLQTWSFSAEMLLVDGEFITGHEALRASMHPFFWEDVSTLETALGRKLSNPPRLVGGMGKRNDEQVAQALDVGHHAMQTQIVDHIRGLDSTTWLELIPSGYFDQGWKMAMEDEATRRLIRKIYFARVKVHEWYRTVQDIMGEDRGLLRTAGNVAIYLAIGMWVRDNPNVLLIDTEVDDQFWRECLPVLKQIWGDDYRPFIASVDRTARQPWTY